jgi:hypothetical protein
LVSENKTLQRLLADLFESNNGQVADKAQWHDALPEKSPDAGIAGSTFGVCLMERARWTFPW